MIISIVISLLLLLQLMLSTPLETQSCLKLRGTSFESLSNDTAFRNASHRSKLTYESSDKYIVDDLNADRLADRSFSQFGCSWPDDSPVRLSGRFKVVARKCTVSLRPLALVE